MSKRKDICNLFPSQNFFVLYGKTIKKQIHVSGDKLRALCEFFLGRCVIFSSFIRLNDCYSLAKLLEHFVIWQSRGAV
jgi:hypothetical protein